MEWALIGLIFAAIIGGGWLLIKSSVSSKVEEQLTKEKLKEAMEAKKRHEDAERNRPSTADDAIDRL